MPSKNTAKIDLPLSYYHVYARGASRQPIFVDTEDYAFFISLLERYLTPDNRLNTAGVPYPNFTDSLELLAYCLMGNHFHMLIYQSDRGIMPQFMRSLLTSYSSYFNRKYGRSGSLFESRYKASRIDTDSYLQHISRYIHLNPRYWRRYPHSSYLTYIGKRTEPWVRPRKILDLFESPTTYTEFMDDYEDVKQMLEEIKYDLADR
ncbi:transposase [Candidatus Saccharibacteria bacterium]|nr:transposase [Candidatus Saccharibacteria bacterium]